MSISFETPETYTGVLLTGQLIEFGYNGTPRWGVVVTPLWKSNCDCYVFGSKEEVPEELLEWVEREGPFNDGDLYTDFGNRYTFKSFNVEKMGSVQNIEFDTYREGEGPQEEDEFVLPEDAVLIWGEDTITIEDTITAQEEG